MAASFSFKMSKISFGDISKSTDGNSLDVVVATLKSASKSNDILSDAQPMVVVNLSFHLGFWTGSWSWMMPAKQLPTQDIIKLDVKDIPRSSKAGLITKGTRSLYLVSLRALPAYLAHGQAYRIRTALNNLCREDAPKDALLTRIIYSSNKMLQEWWEEVVAKRTTTLTPTMPAGSSTLTAGGRRAVHVVLTNSGGRGAPNEQ